MTHYPQTRDEYKAAILQNIYRLVQALELDDPSEYPEGIARNIHHDTREFFHADRWKPRPVFEGVQARIPRDEVLTFRFQTWEPQSPEEAERAILWLSGRVSEIKSLYNPDDGASFQIIPTGKRNPRQFNYRVAQGASLQVWHGKLTPEQAQGRAPFYEHSTQAQKPQEAAV